MSKYELSRTVKTYECQREHLAFDVHSKIYEAQEKSSGLYCGGFFSIVANKDLKKYIAAVDRNFRDDITMDQYLKNVDKIRDIPLYGEESIVASKKANESYIKKLTRISMRKLAIAYLNKLGCYKIETASDEKQFSSGYVIHYPELVSLYTYLFNYVYDDGTEEEKFNKMVKKLPKSFYTLDQSKCPDIKLDPKTPIPFTAVTDKIDFRETSDLFLQQIGRIRKIYEAVDEREGNKNKNKESVVWFL